MTAIVDNKIAHTIRRLADENVAAALREGYKGAVEDYEQTAADCEYIVDEVRRAFGRMPTSAEWADAGFGGAGGAYCDDQAAMVHYWACVRSNTEGGDDSPEQQICRALNVATAEIDDEGNVWVESADGRGWWVTGEALVGLVSRIERGV